MKFQPTHRAGLFAAAMAAALLAACSSAPRVPLTQSGQATPAQPQTDVYAVAPVQSPPPHVSSAATPRAYRADAASHLYARNADRIYKGKLPAMLYAIGVLQVDVDSRGNVRSLTWMRAPSHAPEVVAEIERTVRAAAPYPLPARMGHVVYTDTWLWHKSGRFQLDTLTEGQL